MMIEPRRASITLSTMLCQVLNMKLTLFTVIFVVFVIKLSPIFQTFLLLLDDWVCWVRQSCEECGGNDTEIQNSINDAEDYS